MSGAQGGYARLLQESEEALRLSRLMCGSAPRFRQASWVFGLRPEKPGVAPEFFKTLVPEGQRPSAHQAAEPRPQTTLDGKAALRRF